MDKKANPARDGRKKPTSIPKTKKTNASATSQRKNPATKTANRSSARNTGESSSTVVPRRQHTTAVRSSKKVITPVGTYTVKPIIPAEKAELISVARAMHREDMGTRVQALFQPETEAAIEAVQTDRSVRVPCQHPGCPCPAYQFIPGRVEDIGEFWHQKRRDFDPDSWRAKCRCKHTHVEHGCKTSLKRCKHSGCGCSSFTSAFLCAACDRHWEEHVTVFESEEERRQNGIPCGEAHLPFAEMPNLRNMALTGDEYEAGPVYRAITDEQGPIPRSRAITQDTPVKMGTGFRPVWD